MKPKSLLAALTLATLCAHAETNQLTPQEKASGWILLFDGKTMNGWVDPREKNPPGDAWTIEDGCLKANAHPRITEDLFTQRTFRDFDMSFDWRISTAGNSGVKYRIQDHFFVQDPMPKEKFEAAVQRSYEHRSNVRPDHGQDYVVGFEYQMTDDAKNPDALTNPKHTAGALYDIMVPSTHAAFPVGQYNHSRILVRATHVEHWLNDVLVVNTWLTTDEAKEAIEKRWSVAPAVKELLLKQSRQECPISLQNHGNDTWFQNIKIRPLE
jgi:hypothetical protein